jgi:hypothetical protein
MFLSARSLICGCALGVAAAGGSLPAVPAGQRTASARAGESQTPVQVSLSVGGKRFDSSAPGTCTHAPVASIYQVMAQLWTARQSTDAGSVNLSLWRPTDGSGDMVSLSLNMGRANSNVSTVRGGTVAGSGKVSLAPSGKGGVFSIDAKAADGAVISGTIKCEAFAPHIAEGG